MKYWLYKQLKFYRKLFIYTDNLTNEFFHKRDHLNTVMQNNKNKVFFCDSNVMNLFNHSTV